MIIDSAGNLYGTTGYGGTGNCVLLGGNDGCGTVYELSPPTQKGGAWTETILYSFPTAKQGYLPNGNLVFDSAGNLYGATMFGGGEGTTCDSYYQYCGAVFELSPPKKQGGAWTEKVLHSFAGIESGKTSGDGAYPNGGFALDRKGAIYGTTSRGGYNCPHNSELGCGTAFKLTPKKKGGSWIETTLHRFYQETSDGGEPFAGLTLDPNGNLYGTTKFGGGGNSGSGVVFELLPGPDGKWEEKVLYTFQDNNDGGQPQAPVAFDPKGNLYGTASSGGAGLAGTIFRLRPNAKGDWVFTMLYDFKRPPDGFTPVSPLTFDSTGNLYGTTVEGGAGNTCTGYGTDNCGAVFEANP